MKIFRQGLRRDHGRKKCAEKNDLSYFARRSTENRRTEVATVLFASGRDPTGSSEHAYNIELTPEEVVVALMTLPEQRAREAVAAVLQEFEGYPPEPPTYWNPNPEDPKDYGVLSPQELTGLLCSLMQGVVDYAAQRTSTTSDNADDGYCESAAG